MKLKRTLRIFGIVIILTLLAAAIPVTPALSYTEEVTISPTSGKIGTSVTISGSGFTPSDPASDTPRRVDIYLSNEEIVPGNHKGIELLNFKLYQAAATVGETDAADEGEVTYTTTIPDALTDGNDDVTVTSGNTYYFCVANYGSTLIRAVAEFTIAGGEISIDPEKGPVTTEVTVSGTGFTANKAITIEYDGTEIDIASGNTKTKSNGDFDATIAIPDSVAGTHNIKATVNAASAEATFTVTPAITLSSTSGSAGDSITVSGNGFGKSKTVTISFSGISKTAKADAYGTFTGTFEIPSGLSASTYTVSAEDGTNTATAKLTVKAAATPTPTPTPTTTPTPTPAPTTTPAPSANLSINPTSGSIGTNIMIGDSGFKPNGTVTVKYDDKVIATNAANASGVFVATFAVPPSIHGDHKIVASDGTNTKESKFTVESVAPKIPQPQQPAMGAKVKPPISFEWDDVTDASTPVTYTLQIAMDKDFTASSMMLEKTGITKTSYTLTDTEESKLAGKQTPYYWRIKAVDAAQNEGDWTGAGEFYVAQSFTFTGWPLYATIGIGAVLVFLLGLFVGRRTAYY